MNKCFDAIDTPIKNGLTFNLPRHFPTLSHEERNTDLFGQKSRALSYVHTQLQDIYDGFLPAPDSHIRKECEDLGFIFHDEQNRQLGSLIKTSLPEGWHLQMPNTAKADECFYFRIIDSYGRARYEAYYNANPYRFTATLTRLSPYKLYITHAYSIRDKHHKPVTSGGYHGVILDSNGVRVKDLGFVCCHGRDTDVFKKFEEEAQQIFAGYSSEFDTPKESVRYTRTVVPMWSRNTPEYLIQLINAGAVPRPDAKMRAECEKLGFVFHDENSLGDIDGIFDHAYLYDTSLIKAELPTGWSIIQSRNFSNIPDLWFTVRDAENHDRMHLCFVNAEWAPGLLRATIRIQGGQHHER